MNGQVNERVGVLYSSFLHSLNHVVGPDVEANFVSVPVDLHVMAKTRAYNRMLGHEMRLGCREPEGRSPEINQPLLKTCT